MMSGGDEDASSAEQASPSAAAAAAAAATPTSPAALGPRCLMISTPTGAERRLFLETGIRQPPAHRTAAATAEPAPPPPSYDAAARLPSFGRAASCPPPDAVDVAAAATAAATAGAGAAVSQNTSREKTRELAYLEQGYASTSSLLILPPPSFGPSPSPAVQQVLQLPSESEGGGSDYETDETNEDHPDAHYEFQEPSAGDEQQPATTIPSAWLAEAAAGAPAGAPLTGQPWSAEVFVDAADGSGVVAVSERPAAAQGADSVYHSCAATRGPTAEEAPAAPANAGAQQQQRRFSRHSRELSGDLSGQLMQILGTSNQPTGVALPPSTAAAAAVAGGRQPSGSGSQVVRRQGRASTHSRHESFDGWQLPFSPEQLLVAPQLPTAIDNAVRPTAAAAATADAVAPQITAAAGGAQDEGTESDATFVMHAEGGGSAADSPLYSPACIPAWNNTAAAQLDRLSSAAAALQTSQPTPTVAPRERAISVGPSVGRGGSGGGGSSRCGSATPEGGQLVELPPGLQASLSRLACTGVLGTAARRRSVELAVSLNSTASVEKVATGGRAEEVPTEAGLAAAGCGDEGVPLGASGDFSQQLSEVQPMAECPQEEQQEQPPQPETQSGACPQSPAFAGADLAALQQIARERRQQLQATAGPRSIQLLLAEMKGWEQPQGVQQANTEAANSAAASSGPLAQPTTAADHQQGQPAAQESPVTQPPHQLPKPAPAPPRRATLSELTAQFDRHVAAAAAAAPFGGLPPGAAAIAAVLAARARSVSAAAGPEAARAAAAAAVGRRSVADVLSPGASGEEGFGGGPAGLLQDGLVLGPGGRGEESLVYRKVGSRVAWDMDLSHQQ
jgi:hypothetical protein